MTIAKQRRSQRDGGGISSRHPFPDFENTAELDREVADYIAKAVPPMAKYQDGEHVVRRYREERAYRTGRHAAFVADFVARYETAEAREKAELTLLKLQADFAMWRKAEKLPDWTTNQLCNGQWMRGTGKVKQVGLTSAQRRIAEDFSCLMMKAGRHEGFLRGRQGVWLVRIPSPWSESAPLCWRVPLPDERGYRDAAIVPARDYLYGWALSHPCLRDIVMADDAPDHAAELPSYLARMGISVELVIEAQVPNPQGERRESNVIPFR
jgi:hypothetical protein